MMHVTRFDTLDALTASSNGYLLTSQVLRRGVSKPTLAEYVRKRNMERVGHGVYLAPNAWPDELYQLSLSSQSIVFSHETALLLHGLTEREPKTVHVTVKTGYNASRLRRQGIRVHQIKPELAALGITDVQTSLGNSVRAYDRERTICDILRSKKRMDIQVFRYALKEYMADDRKNLNRLMAYAKEFRLEAVVRTYTEVLL